MNNKDITRFFYFMSRPLSTVRLLFTSCRSLVPEHRIQKYHAAAAAARCELRVWTANALGHSGASKTEKRDHLHSVFERWLDRYSGHSAKLKHFRINRFGGFCGLLFRFEHRDGVLYLLSAHDEGLQIFATFCAMPFQAETSNSKQTDHVVRLPTAWKQ
jgi:hypothetical protein